MTFTSFRLLPFFTEEFWMPRIIWHKYITNTKSKKGNTFDFFIPFFNNGSVKFDITLRSVHFRYLIVFDKILIHTLIVSKIVLPTHITRTGIYYENSITNPYYTHRYIL